MKNARKTHANKALLHDVTKTLWGSTFTIPAGTLVKLVEGASGTQGDLYGVADVALMKRLSGNAHDPDFRWCYVDAADVLTTQESMLLDRHISGMGAQWHFFRGYVGTALALSQADTGDESDGDAMDVNHDIDDIAPETLESMAQDCAAFYDEFKELIHGDDAPLSSEFDGPLSHREAAFAGYMFWASRCGHGVGFWDGRYSDDAGKAMDAVCGFKGKFDNVDLYLGDDGKIYQ